MCPKCRGSAFARSAEVLQIQSAEVLHLGEVQRFCTRREQQHRGGQAFESGRKQQQNSLPPALVRSGHGGL